MRFHVYVPQPFVKDVKEFVVSNGKSSSRIICSLIERYNNANISIHIPTIRKILQKNPEQIKYLRELLNEFN